VLVLASVVQALTLAVAALVAWTQAKEARALRKARAQPYVVISLQLLKTHYLELVIENLGTTAARDISIAIDPPFESSLDLPPHNLHVAQWTALSHIATLAPTQRMAELADSVTYRNQHPELQNRYTALGRYRGDHGDQYEYTYDLDFGVWMGRYSVDQKGQHELVQATERLAEAFIRFSNSPLDVHVYDGEKADEAERASIAEFEERTRTLPSESP
jgi:hypothetical protein